MGLNAYRDEAGAFVAALGESGRQRRNRSSVVRRGSRGVESFAHRRRVPLHQIYDVLFLLFSLAAERGLDLDPEWDGIGKQKLAKYLKDN